MPLRSVEAASRDDAIAAAREQFGPQARVVGVRRVRSGGVLGFFATERYVAEVAEVAEPTAGAAVRPTPGRTRRDDDVAPADFSSPLASAAPARARAGAPARNGAAAWAAEAARTADDIPEAARAAAAAARAARANAAARSSGPAVSRATEAAPPRTDAPARTGAQTAPRPADDERVSELVGLLNAQQPEPAAPAYSRATFPRTPAPRAGAVARAGDPLPDEPAETGAPVRGGQRATSTAAPAAPSPFTAALARMVSGDQDVQQAVQDALAQPVETRPRDDAEPWPVRAEPVRTAETSVPPVARQEEETVGDQVVAPPSTTERPVEVPTWAAAPEDAAPSVSPREEAIADLLRGALAQGHSDEALAGILRKVLAGASPQTALTEPVVAAPAEPVFAVPTRPVPSFDLPAMDLPVLDLPEAEPSTPVAAAPVAAAPVADAPVADAPVADAPVEAPADGTRVAEQPVPEAPAAEAPVLQSPVVELPVVEAPVVESPSTLVAEIAPPVTQPTPPPAPAFSSFGGSMWGTPSSATLWGEPTPAPTTRSTPADAPIWAEVARQEHVSASPSPAAADEDPSPRTAAEAPEAAAEPEPAPETEPAPEPELAAGTEESLEQRTVADAVEHTAEDADEETDVAELAPALARTASDPAPMMSLDATTVMPPLSLLPPLPSSRGRGRGRPPVPPAAARPRPSSSGPAPAVDPTTAAEGTAASPAVDPPAADAPTTDALFADAPAPAAQIDAPRATMPLTRSLATVTRLPVAPLMAGPDMPELPEDRDQVVADAPPAPAPSATPAAPAPDDVSGRLQLLGLPVELLGDDFDSDVTELGTYAALTRSLALQLRKPPELPRGAGEAVFVVGPGADALRAARSLAASMHLDPDCVQWATRGDLAGLAPRSSRVTSVDAAIDRRQESIAAGTVTIVAVDTPLRTDAYWMAQLVSVWAPTAVWAVVEATRKPEDVQPWIDGLPRVDALIVQDTDLSADPAAVLRRVDAPVALLDGVRATPHRWASLLCERLERPTT